MATNIYDMADTWTGGTRQQFLKSTITDTSSAAESAFEEYLIASAVKWRLRKDGAPMIYNAYTSESVYERAELKWSSNTFVVDVTHLGAVQREFEVRRGGTFQFGTSGDGVSCGRVRMGTTSASGSANVILDASTSGILKVWTGGVADAAARMATLQLTDGISAPGTVAGYAQIYVDTADGDLKVKFGDGTVKTIVVDT